MRIIVIAEIRCNFGIIFFIIHLFWGALEARKLPSPTRFNRRHMARLQRAALILRRRRLRTPGRKRTPRELRNDGPHLPFRASRDFRKSISLGDLCTAALCPAATTAAPFVTSQFAGLGYIYIHLYTRASGGEKRRRRKNHLGLSFWKRTLRLPVKAASPLSLSSARFHLAFRLSRIARSCKCTHHKVRAHVHGPADFTSNRIGLGLASWTLSEIPLSLSSLLFASPLRLLLLLLLAPLRLLSLLPLLVLTMGTSAWLASACGSVFLVILMLGGGRRADCDDATGPDSRAEISEWSEGQTLPAI